MIKSPNFDQKITSGDSAERGILCYLPVASMAAMANCPTVSGTQNSERGSLRVLKSFGPNSASFRRLPNHRFPPRKAPIKAHPPHDSLKIGKISIDPSAAVHDL